MAAATILGHELSRAAMQLNVVLFSLPGCQFCAEVREHYLAPLKTSERRRLTIAEVGIESAEPMRDWQERVVAQAEFAKANSARFAPTVMFFDGSGKTLAAPITGLSRDFFGSYLEQRIAASRRALGDAAAARHAAGR